MKIAVFMTLMIVSCGSWGMAEDVVHLSSLISHISLTNHAGRVVSGEFGGVTNGTFIVSGRAYPLSILPPGEQKRVKTLAGLDVRTAKQKRLDHARDMRLERIRLREAEGEIDKATAERLRGETLNLSGATEMLVSP